MRWPLKAASLPRLAIWMVAGVLLWLGTSFFLFYTGQKAYYVRRNFRILAAIGDQLDESVTSHGRIFRSLLTRAETSSPAGAPPLPGPPSWYTAARDFVPVLKLVDNPNTLPIATASLPATPTVGWDGGETLTFDFGERRLLRVRAEPFLDGIVGQERYAEAFDAIVLAAANGQVGYQTAHSDDQLRFNHLSTLTDADPSKADGSRFLRLAQATNVADVHVNGASYKLFLQPCCRTLGSQRWDGPNGTPAFVIAGLVSSGRLNSDSMEVSFSIVVAFGAVVLLALVAWPFLKLVMLGESQRVTVTHVLFVGTCAVGGLTLLVILLLDAFAYRRFIVDVDAQLQAFAGEIQQEVIREVDDASTQLECLQNQTLEPWRRLKKQRAADAETPERLDVPFPPEIVANSRSAFPCSGGDYEAFSLIHQGGMQHIKLAPADWASERVSVAERRYFLDAAADRSGTGGPYLESIRSWTNGNLRAVLSRPTGDADFPVAALTSPMHSLIDPLVPHGFGYAVLDGSGTVLFHADSQRNLNEKFFAESDFSRRLRAAVATRQSSHLVIRYWGQDHKAYITPVEKHPEWTLVTFFDLQSAWALQEEWVVGAFGFLSLYLATFAVLLFFVVRGCPGGHSAWLWPDAAKQRDYLALAALHSGTLVLAAVLAPKMQGWRLVLFGLLLPLASALVTFVLLRRARPDDQRVNGSIGTYVLAATLCLAVLTLIPGAAFFKAAYQLHLESYLRYHQLQLAQAVSSRNPLRDTRDRGATVAYFSFFYDSRRVVSDGVSHCTPEASSFWLDRQPADLIPGVIEDYLPYQSDASVEMREMLRDTGRGARWSWRRCAPAADRQRLLQLVDGDAVVMSSSLPPVSGAGLASSLSSQERWWLSLQLVGIFAVVTYACYRTVRFVCRQVFLVGVTQPSTAPAGSGENRFLLHNDQRPPVIAQECCHIDVEQLWKASIAPDAQNDPWVDALRGVDRWDHALVVISNLHVRLQDGVLAEKKLALLEELLLQQQRSLIVHSSVSPRLIADRVPALRQRWEVLFASFVLEDQRFDDPPPEPVPSSLRGWFWWAWVRGVLGARERPGSPPTWQGWIRAANASSGSTFEQRRLYRLLSTLRHEEGHDPVLTRISRTLQREILEGRPRATSAQLIAAVGDRAAGYYRSLWSSCAAQEKLVLAHLAQDGLVSPRCAPVIRRLMRRGLVRAVPHLALMNRSFQEFVLSSAHRAEILSLERSRDASAWDRFQWPFATVVGAVCVFFVLTQRELFDSSVASLGALAGVLPAVLKAIGLSRESTVAAGVKPTPGQDTA